MRKLIAALAMLAVTSTMSGCVIGPGPVVSQGQAPRDNQRLNANFTKDLERPALPRDPVALVRGYLRAAADNSDSRLATLRSYIKDQNWKPGKALNIYRVFDPERGGQIDNIIPVKVPMQKIGVLNDDGRIEPYVGGRVDIEFKVLAVEYLLEDVPTDLMLSDEVLDKYIEPRAIYFWNKEGKRLIPDIRYVPSNIPESEKAKLLIQYLYEPPSPWLSQAVKAPAGQWPVRGGPVYTDGVISIDLQNQLAEGELPRLATQLEQMLKHPVQFKIQGVPVQPGRYTVFQEPAQAAWFAIQKGSVVRLSSGADRGAHDVPLTAAINTGVQWALFSRREESVALSKGGNFLIGPSSAPKPANGNKPVDQAAWLEGDSRAALVLSGQRLYEVVPGLPGVEPKWTALAGPLPGPVTGFSVVPDGRIALVIDKRFYMAALYRNGEVLSVTQPEQVPTALDQVQHVALKQLDAVIAGVGLEQNKSKLVLARINVDGARQERWMDYSESEQISHLVADFRSGGQAYYDYNGDAYQFGSGWNSAVRANQIVRVDPSPAPSTPPSAPPSPAPPSKITAASFEG